jgi:hypothetical protein
VNRAELTDEQARQLLVTNVRHHLATPGLTFPVWDGFDLQWRDGVLYQANSDKPLIAHNDLYGMSDEEIERAVLGLPAPKQSRRKKVEVIEEPEEVSNE